jgi:hypothetical protein
VRRAASVHPASGNGLSRTGVVLALVLAALIGAGQARAQSIEDLARQAAPRDTLPPGPPPSPLRVVAGEVGLGTVLAAAAGYGVGLVAEIFCSNCDASKAGGDTPGILVGLPAGAVAGVWIVGRADPPLGERDDTVLGAFAGAAVFAGFTKILEDQGDGLKWSAVVFPAALAAMGWNRSRALVRPAVTLRRDPPSRWGKGELHAELDVVRVRF